MTDDLLQRLRESAIEIASAGHAGWGNVCSNAADEIERLRARAESAERERDALRERIAKGVVVEWKPGQRAIMIAEDGGK